MRPPHKGAGAFARDDAEAIELTETGRYLLVVMMREFFICVNGIRDLARARLLEAERELFEEIPACSRPIRMPQPVLAGDGTRPPRPQPALAGD